MINYDITSKLDSFCHENGITPPPVWEESDTVIRFRTDGSSESGAYLLFENENNYHLRIMDWSKGDTEFRGATFMKDDSGLYGASRPVHKVPNDRSREKFEAEREKVQAEAAARCREKYLSLRGATPDNPYCKSKGILPAPGWKEDDRGTLFIPFFDGRGSLDFDPDSITTIERIWIDEDGKTQKRWEKGGRKKGSYFPIKGDVKGRLFFAEGSATAKSITDATGCTCIMAGDCGNLEHVARYFPTGIVVADNDSDKSNAGEEAAKKTGLPYVLIPEAGMDANDYVVKYGVGKLRQLLLPYPSGCHSLSNWISETSHRSWRLEGIYMEGPGVYQGHGPSHGGKTHVKISQQIALATGTDWMGRRTKQCNVLSLIGESAVSEKERIRANIQERPEISEDVLDEHLFLCTDVFPINEKDGEEKLCDILDFYASYGMKIDIMFIDSFRLYYSGTENDNDAVSMFVKTLKRIADKYDMTIVYYCHDRKADKDGNIGDQARGGQSLYDLSDAVHRIHNEKGVIVYENQKNKVSGLDETICMDIVSCPLDGETDNFGNPVISAYLTENSASIRFEKAIVNEAPVSAAEKAINEYLEKYKYNFVSIDTLGKLYEEEYRSRYPRGKNARGDVPEETKSHYDRRVKDAVDSRTKKLREVASDPDGRYELREDNTIYVKGTYPQKNFAFDADGGGEDGDGRTEGFTYELGNEDGSEYGDLVAEAGTVSYFSEDDDEPDVPFAL